MNSKEMAVSDISGNIVDEPPLLDGFLKNYFIFFKKNKIWELILSILNQRPFLFYY